MLPLVISAVKNIISVCNIETLNTHLKPPDSLKYQELEAVSDTGAQVNVACLSHIQLLKIPIESLCKPSHQLKHAGGSSLEITGSSLILIQRQEKTFTIEFCFIQNVNIIYLSIM